MARWRLACLFLLWANPASLADGPDPAALARTARATTERLAHQAASWTSNHTLPGGGRIIVEVLQTPGRRRLTLALPVENTRVVATRITERDGVWYVIDSGARGKYRPYEAPTQLPLTYLYLGNADLVLATDAASWTHEATKGTVATYRTPLPEPMRRTLQSVVHSLDEAASKGALTAESKAALKSSKERLTNGTAIEVDTATGVILSAGLPERRVRVTDFHWLDKVDDREFDVGGDWVDFTDDPTGGDRDDLLLIGHNGLWQPGMRTGETDCRLLDVATGKFRRVPFRGANCIGGCFLKGRTSVAVSGPHEGRMSVYEVDLRTGANRRLGGEALANGVTLSPTVSPDGKTLAVQHGTMVLGTLQTQIHVIDLATNTARAIGEPHDMASASWLADGSGLILVLRHPGPTPPERVAGIARMDLDGRVTPIRDGDMPTLIGDRRTILYRDNATRTWRTCGLDGNDDKPYADGLAAHGFPAPSPDGKRLVMMRFAAGTAPVPELFQLGESEGRPLTSVRGLWGWPAWR
jgi:hypothetical protein